MVNRFMNNRFGVTIFGAVILAVGISMLGQSDVTCGGRTMQPGDECVETRKGKSTTRSYDEQKQHDSLIGWGALLAGAGMTIGGVARIVVVARRRRDGAPDPDPGATPVR